MLAGRTMPCQWIDASCERSELVTRSVTVSPSFHRSVGAGSEPFTVCGDLGCAGEVGDRLADPKMEVRSRERRAVRQRLECLRMGVSAPGAEASNDASYGQAFNECSPR